ncbi:efflux RND transporter periplasmic adaptor subunit [Paludibaculum fermentans]|uniref:Efflux RND transporter periplasmic adaptor subunit n=1 Tax=Paludibaculum fermentans TaxID=1473598 RepID=A0A7S7SIB1_PALFE|nr:efflux RND transporter periplasmic adaptor subunit [Paludibaculum fermentans]QOY85884.1 efflux RND transporter periplasmic adaptor subunit [Paludibaculum fermentans]
MTTPHRTNPISTGSPRQGARAIPLLTLACGALALAACGRKEQAHAMPPPPVEVVQVRQQDVPNVREWVATMDGLVNAQVRPQVTGYLVRQLYRNGDRVSRGTPLFQIDTRTLQAAVNEAKANVEQARGHLLEAQGQVQNAEAQRGKSKLDLNRARPLAAEQAISRQELDDAVQADLVAAAQVASAQAAVSQAKSAIDAAQAKLETARLNLGFATVVSPVDGIAGINAAQIGDLVGPQSPALTIVSTVDPILVSFTFSEQEYLGIRRLPEGSDAGKRSSELEFSLQLTDGSTYPLKGKLHAVDRNVDIKTGAIAVQVAFPNPRGELRPGGFGRISTVAGVDHGALTVPQRAISEIQGAYLVAVVTPENTIQLRPVKLGAAVGPLRVIKEGLQPGDRVVAEGIQKIRDGMKVQPQPFETRAEGASR